jgi:hypothetical protein
MRIRNLAYFGGGFFPTAEYFIVDFFVCLPVIGRTFPRLLLIGFCLGLKWAQECIAALSVWYHVVAWSLPLLKTTAALLLSVVGKFPT